MGKRKMGAEPPYPKGRGKPWRAKLTEAQVRECRALYARGDWTIHALAKRYKVSWPTVRDVVNGVTWKHLLPPDHPAAAAV